MNTPGTPTSHFYIDRNGDVEQYVDTDARSSANLEGNHDCLTIDSRDGFGEVWHDGDPVPPWNQRQVDGLVELVAWLCITHGIATQELPFSLAGTRGIGWHRQGIDGNSRAECSPGASATGSGGRSPSARAALGTPGSGRS